MYTVRDSIGIGDCRGTDGRSTLRAIENVGLEIDLPNGIAGKTTVPDKTPYGACCSAF